MTKEEIDAFRWQHAPWSLLQTRDNLSGIHFDRQTWEEILEEVMKDPYGTNLAIVIEEKLEQIEKIAWLRRLLMLVQLRAQPPP